MHHLYYVKWKQYVLCSDYNYSHFLGNYDNKCLLLSRSVKTCNKAFAMLARLISVSEHLKHIIFLVFFLLIICVCEWLQTSMHPLN